MPDRRGSRFALEVLFLLGLAVGLTLAKLTALEIAGVMMVGWVVVAALEWAAWRGEPHYGSGLPPRYFVPRLNLPPSQPLEQVATGYPEAARDEAPTWIASAALRQEMLGEWPVSMAPSDVASDSDGNAGAAVADPWLVAELPSAPLGELEADGPAPVAPEPEPQPLPAATDEQELDVVLAAPVHGVARHSLDPLAEPPARRRFGRGGGEAPATVEVPARPERARALPGLLTRDGKA